MGKESAQVLAVTLNPALDRGIEVPDFAIGAHQVGCQLFRRAAGKAVNLARVLNALKVPTAITGFVGRNQQDYFERHLNREHLSCQLFAVDGNTRENVTIIDPVNKQETHIRDRGFDVTASNLTKLRKKLALICREGLIVCFSGSLPHGVDTDAFLELIQVCQMRKASVCVDSSGSVLRACAALKLYLAKPNMAELSEMLNCEITNSDQIIDVADRLTNLVDTALVTCGRDGGYLFSREQWVRGRVDVDPDEVTNTVGCGDAMLAGFLAGVLSKRDLADSYRYALAVATSAAVSLVPAEVRTNDIKRFYDTAKMEHIPHS